MEVEIPGLNTTLVFIIIKTSKPYKKYVINPKPSFWRQMSLHIHA